MQILCILTVVAYVDCTLLLGIVPFLLLCGLIGNVTVPNTKSLSELEGQMRGPVLQKLTSTMQGLQTIRVHDQGGRLEKEFYYLQVYQ